MDAIKWSEGERVKSVTTLNPTRTFFTTKNLARDFLFTIVTVFFFFYNPEQVPTVAELQGLWNENIISKPLPTIFPDLPPNVHLLTFKTPGWTYNTSHEAHLEDIQANCKISHLPLGTFCTTQNINIHRFTYRV